MRAGWLAVAAAAGVLVLFSSSAGAAPQTLRAVAGSSPDYLDPQLSYTNEGWMAMYDTYIPLLTYRHADGEAGSEVIPGLARSLPRITDGGKTYTLFLRRGLKYSDGSSVRASDFTSTVKRLFKLTSGGSSFYADIVGVRRFLKTRRGGIGGIETHDRTGKIVIHLLRPAGTFTNLLALPFVALVPPGTPARDQSSSPPPATGPYAITNSTPGLGWSYARNPEWKSNNAKLMPQLPTGHVNMIHIAVLRDAATQIRGVEQGVFDWIFAEPPVNRGPALKGRYKRAQLRVEPLINLYYFWMNTKRAPFDDLRVRQAVNYAIDPAALRRIYAGTLSATQQILPPEIPGYEQFELYPHDMGKAKQLIAEADPADREITVWTDREWPNDKAGAYYQSVLQRLGFSVHLKILTPDNYFFVIGDRSTSDLDTGWGNWFEDYPHPDDFFRPLLSAESILSTYNSNWSLIADPALSAKTKQLALSPLGSEQAAGYAQLDREYMERAPWAPYGVRTGATFVSRAIDLGKVVWNPTFGADLASFQFK